MTLPKKGARRYGVTFKKGITKKIYIKTKSHKKVYLGKALTSIELDELAKMMGMKVSRVK
jgi:hypothetical protein